MNPVADNIWETQRPLNLGPVHLDHRMTVSRLDTGDLWVHSPIRLNPRLQKSLAELGPVTDLVAPSVFHDLFIQEWADAYPQARLHAADGLRQEHGDWRITDELTTSAAPTWTDEIEGLVLQGMPKINETVFVHKPSGTLIVADLVFNYTDYQLNTATSLTLRMAGTYQKFSASRLFRMFIKDRGAMRASLDQVLTWNFDRILPGHGHAVETDGSQSLRQAWNFLS